MRRIIASVAAVVLAAGKGTRLRHEKLPKVMRLIGGRPMLAYVLKTLETLRIKRKVVVVGYLADEISRYFGRSVSYAYQKNQLGTADALKAAKSILIDHQGIILILKGDQPFVSRQSLIKLINKVKGGAAIAVLAIQSQSSSFDNFGRFLLDERNRPVAIVEARNATADQLKIRLFNLGTYAVRSEIIWQLLSKIKRDPVSKEYYLTDIISLATKNHFSVKLVMAQDETEAIGINTPEQLAEARLKMPLKA